MINLRVCVTVSALFSSVPALQAQRVAVLDDDSNATLSYTELATITLGFESLYTLEQDIPEQRAALRTLYDATGGPDWTSLYNNIADLDAQLAFEAGLPATGMLRRQCTSLLLYMPPVINSSVADRCNVPQCNTVPPDHSDKQGSMVYKRVLILPFHGHNMLSYIWIRLPKGVQLGLLFHQRDFFAWYVMQCLYICNCTSQTRC